MNKKRISKLRKHIDSKTHYYEGIAAGIRRFTAETFSLSDEEFERNATKVCIALMEISNNKDDDYWSGFYWVTNEILWRILEIKLGKYD